MKVRSKLSLTERATVGFFDTIVKLVYGGMPNPVGEEAMKTLGIGGYMRWMSTSTAIIDVMNKRYGDAIAQMLFGFAAMWKGCPYCAFGHVYASCLLIYRDDDVLCPIDTHTLSELFDMTDDEAMDEVRRLLADPRYERMLQLATRLYELALNTAEGTTDDDDVLLGALSVWDWVTECTIVQGMIATPDDTWPPHLVARNKKLMQRYQDARRQAPAAPA